MPALTITLSAIALLSLGFAFAIVIESRRAERTRRTFLLSINAPHTLRLKDWPLRIVYLIGSLLLALMTLFLPYFLGILPFTHV